VRGAPERWRYGKGGGSGGTLDGLDGPGGLGRSAGLSLEKKLQVRTKGAGD